MKFLSTKTILTFLDSIFNVLSKTVVPKSESWYPKPFFFNNREVVHISAARRRTPQKRKM